MKKLTGEDVYNARYQRNSSWMLESNQSKQAWNLVAVRLNAQLLEKEKADEQSDECPIPLVEE